MKFKDLLTISENKKTKQINASIKKRKLAKAGISMEDLLNTKLKNCKLK